MRQRLAVYGDWLQFAIGFVCAACMAVCMLCKDAHALSLSIWSSKCMLAESPTVKVRVAQEVRR